MKRLAAYCRVSTKKEAQLDSLENQKEFFAQYAVREGLTLVRVYADEGVSGRQLKNRTAFHQMLTDAGSGTFDLLAVKDISRFARNTVDCLQALRTLRRDGVTVRFLSCGQQNLGDSEFILTVFASLAQEESANLSRRIKFGKEQNARKGRVPPLLFGYDRVDNYTLRINPAEAETVRLMFRLYLAGWGSAAIARELNRQRRPTKLRGSWDSRSVRRVLRNPVYSGELVNHKTVVTDYLDGTTRTLPPEEQFRHARPAWAIVSPEEFSQARRERIRRNVLFFNGVKRDDFAEKIPQSMCFPAGQDKEDGTDRNP